VFIIFILTKIIQRSFQSLLLVSYWTLIK